MQDLGRSDPDEGLGARRIGHLHKVVNSGGTGEALRREPPRLLVYFQAIGRATAHLDDIYLQFPHQLARDYGRHEIRLVAVHGEFYAVEGHLLGVENE